LLKEKPRPSKVVDFPGEELKGTSWERVRIIVPAAIAHGEAQLAAHKRMRDDLKIPREEWNTETGAAMLGDLTAKELLARVVFSEQEIGSPGSHKYARLFSDSTDVERLLSADEIAILFALYQQVAFELGPRLSVLTEAQVDAWIEVLKRGFDPLASLELLDCHVLIRGLHRRIVKGSVASDTSDLQDSPQSSSPSTSESTSLTSVMDTISFGAQPFPQSTGSSDPISSDDAAALARRMRGES
jgi:hypothetical protein